MITWRDMNVAQERHADQLRRAEQERLLRQVQAASRKPTIWQIMKIYLFEKGTAMLVKVMPAKLPEASPAEPKVEELQNHLCGQPVRADDTLYPEVRRVRKP